MPDRFPKLIRPGLADSAYALLVRCEHGATWARISGTWKRDGVALVCACDPAGPAPRVEGAEHVGFEVTFDGRWQVRVSGVGLTEDEVWARIGVRPHVGTFFDPADGPQAPTGAADAVASSGTKGGPNFRGLRALVAAVADSPQPSEPDAYRVWLMCNEAAAEWRRLGERP